MKPHVTANTLASFLTAKTPERRQRIVRSAWLAQQSPRDYPPYYQSLRTPARRFLANGATSSAGLNQLITRMAERGGKKWHQTDARITTEAAKALVKLSPKIRNLGVTFLMPDAGKAKIEFPNIDVLVSPHMLVEKQSGTAKRIGAMRFYIAKESTYELGQKGAELVASMQHLWLTRISSGRIMPDHELCLVIECFQQRITSASIDSERAFKIIAQGARDFARMWEGLDSSNAAAR